MKKIASILFLLSGTLFIIISITSEDTNTWLPLGCAFITIGIVFRKKEGARNDSDEGGLLGLLLSFFWEKININNESHYYSEHTQYGEIMPLGGPFFKKWRIRFH